MAPRQKLLTTEDVADIFGVAPQTVTNWRLSGRLDLPHLKINRMVRYDPDAVDEFLANAGVAESDDESDDSDDEYDDYEDEDEDDDAMDDDSDETADEED